MINSTTWLYGAEVLPVALRSKVMGLAAASHFIVNVAGTHTQVFGHFQFLGGTNKLPSSLYSHRSGAQCIFEYPRELLLRVRGVHYVLFGSGIPLVPVSPPSLLLLYS